MSHTSSRSAGTDEWEADGAAASAPTDGAGATEADGPTDNGWSPIEYNRHQRRHERAPLSAHELTSRRRAAAARARRRRLRLVDLALGLALALLAIALAPGLAIVALLAVIGLLACAASLAYRQIRRRRVAARRPPREGLSR